MPLSFLADPLPRWVDRRVVVIEPGGNLRYDTAEWRDHLVIVEAGEVALECACGGTTTFRAGDVLWLVDLPLRRVRNDGVEPVVLVAISRHTRAIRARS